MAKVMGSKWTEREGAKMKEVSVQAGEMERK